MFWRKKTPPAEAPVPTAALGAEPSSDRAARVEADLDASVEAVAGILRALGRHSLPIGNDLAEGVGRHLERWASHVLVLAPHPGPDAEVPRTDEAEGQRPARREWAKLVRFVEGHRKTEQELLSASHHAMRDAILTMLQCFGSASLGQSKSDVAVSRHLGRLRTTVQSGSIEQLRREALAVADVVTKALDEQRQRSLEQAEQLQTKMAALREELDEAQRDVETDPLTKLHNRRAFDAALERTCLLAQVVRRPLTLLMVDVDHFKAINDRHGHPAGDEVLRELANVLARSFPRRSDVVARYGGEEFAVILTETTAEEARRLVGRCLTAVRALRVAYGDRTLGVTASVGVAERADGESGAEVLARADLALYRAKETGRDRAVEAVLPRPPVRVLVDEDPASRRREAG
jgi:diguanylate cyclase